MKQIFILFLFKTSFLKVVTITSEIKYPLLLTLSRGLLFYLIPFTRGATPSSFYPGLFILNPFRVYVFRIPVGDCRLIKQY